MLKYKVFYVNPIRSCSYLLWDGTGESVVIDAGYQDEGEFSRLVKAVGDEKLKAPSKVLLTHCHFDHVMGLSFLVDKWNPQICFSQRDESLLKSAAAQCAAYGIENIIQPELKNVLHIDDGDIIAFGNVNLSVISTPGHTKGGLCFYDKEDETLFTGDTLFQGSVGRTDLPGGNCEQLITCIQAKLMTLPPRTKVLPGHGYPTTVSDELSSNPYIR